MKTLFRILSLVLALSIGPAAIALKPAPATTLVQSVRSYQPPPITVDIAAVAQPVVAIAPVVHHYISVLHHGYATARECVAMTENGGKYDRSSNQNHFGRYQFSRSAWASFGGSPSTWGTASSSEQDAVFNNAWSQGPAVQYQQWLKWDGC